MKSFLLVFFICFVQICMSASINNKIDDESVDRIDVKEIETLQSEWSAIPGINKQAVEDFADVLENFSKNSTTPEIVKALMDLLNIILNKDVADDKKVKLQVATLIESSEEKDDKDAKSDDDGSSEEILILLSGKVLSVDDSSELDKELSSKLNESQKTRALQFFNKIKTEESKEIEDGLTDLINDTMEVVFGNSYTYKDGKITSNAVDGNQE